VGKRGNGEGSIYRRRNGTWAAQYTVWTAEGRRRRSVSGKTRAEVSRKLTRAMADRDGGLVCDAGKLTVGEHIGADDLNAEPGQIFRPVRCGSLVSARAVKLPPVSFRIARTTPPPWAPVAPTTAMILFPAIANPSTPAATRRPATR
jgi:hypothetical protein